MAPIGLPLHRPSEASEVRLHVAIGPECNNLCLFCMEHDREARKSTNGALTPPIVRAILEQGRGAPEVCFTSGEPTLVSHLPRYVQWAKALGFPTISIATNGRRLAYPGYARRLAQAGVNLFHIAIHGHCARLHDGLVRSPGAFEQTLAGLRQAAALRGPGVRVHTSTVITVRNLPHLREIRDLVANIGVDQTVFNVARPSPGFAQIFTRVLPRYADVVAAVAALGGPPFRPPMYLVDVPQCVTEVLPRECRGWIETFKHHEADARGSDEPLREIVQLEVDRPNRVKVEGCGQCIYDAACDGFWREYADHYGLHELRPVHRPRSGGLER